jgi:signal transduction histidine kinase
MDDDVTVEVDGPDEAYVLGDDLLPDVLGNVMANAVEHGHDDPTIEVTVTDVGDHVRVAVADDGPGIDDPARVLKRGEKGASSTGTGFGLYFVATMVDAYGGHVAIRDDDGPGAVVELELPAA